MHTALPIFCIFNHLIEDNEVDQKSFVLDKSLQTVLNHFLSFMCLASIKIFDVTFLG